MRNEILCRIHEGHLGIDNKIAKCEKHCTISLMSDITKLVLRVLMNRLRARSLLGISQVQYGFMPDRGTRNAFDTEAERCIHMFH